MQGINSVNYECYRQAARAGLRGVFRALLASGERGLENTVRYSDRDLPVVNIRGDLLFPAWADLLQEGRGGFSAERPLYSFSGDNVLNHTHWPVKQFWHGAGQDWGVSAPSSVSPPGTCNDWRTDSPLAIGLASRLISHSSYLLAPQRVPCNKKLTVLCVESGSGAPARHGTSRRDNLGG